jgi:hypothetical protein
VTEHRLFDPADPPEWLDPEWWREREHCDHLGSPTGAHVARLKAAAAMAGSLALSMKGGYVVDLGAGDGALLSLLPDSLRDCSFGYDIIRADVMHANTVRGVKVWLRNVGKAVHRGAPIGGPVVVLTEVLEHMADPHGFLADLRKQAGLRYVVASSPANETPEQHEWNHAYCWDTHGYAAMFEAAGFMAKQLQPVEWSQLWTFEVAP